MKKVDVDVAPRPARLPDWFGPGWMERFFTPSELWRFPGVGMNVEEFVEDGTLVVRLELPGVDPDEDVEITITDGRLHVRAERREETKDKNGYRSEFRYGSFSRTVSLPAGATEDDVKATYNDGILEVRIPIDHAAAEAKKIPVTRT